MLKLADLLDEFPLGQQRTSNRKQFVFIRHKDVIKGPFKEERVQEVFRRSEQLKTWRTPYIVHPKEVLESDVGYFIIYPKVGCREEDNITCHKESFSDYEYSVIVRYNLVKLNDVIEEDGDFQDHIPNIAEALIDLFLLGVGDTGLFNILADNITKEVFIIDFEENRGNAPKTEFFYFSKDPRASVRKLWHNETEKHFGDIAKRLRKKNIQDPKIDKRRKFAIEILKGLQPKGETDIEEEAELVEEEAEINGTEIPEDWDGRILAQANSSFDEFGAMEYKGPRGASITRTGHRTDEAKSAMQKYIRRGVIDKALFAAFDMFKFGDVEGGRVIQSNMLNRIAVIAAEDIGPANLDLCVQICDWRNGDDRDPAKLAAFVCILAASKKTRIQSHLFRAYVTKEGRKYAESIGMNVKEGSDEPYLLHREELLEKDKNPFWKKADRNIIDEFIFIELFVYSEMFHRRLKKKDPLAVYWLGKYQYLAEMKHSIKVSARNRRTKAMVVIWDMIRDVIKNKEAVDVLMKAYFEQSDNRSFLMTAVAACLYGIEYETIDLTEAFEVWENSKQLQILLLGQYQFEIDEYAIDMHTRKGRSKGKKRSDFVEEGALVSNQDPDLWDELLNEVYTKS